MRLNSYANIKSRKHTVFKAEFSIIEGEEEFIPYPHSGNRQREKSKWNDKEGYFEVKINKEIRNYTESMFFGLSLRSSFFRSFLRVAVGFSFCFVRIRNGNTRWMCILGAAPFALWIYPLQRYDRRAICLGVD
jgi:hypothetical protein